MPYLLIFIGLIENPFIFIWQDQKTLSYMKWTKSFILKHLKTFTYFSKEPRFDLDQDGKKEFVVFHIAHKYFVIQSDYSHEVNLGLPTVESTYQLFAQAEWQSPPELFVQTGPVCMLFSYTKIHFLRTAIFRISSFFADVVAVEPAQTFI